MDTNPITLPCSRVIIIICGDVIRNKLLVNIRKAKFIAVIAMRLLIHVIVSSCLLFFIFFFLMMYNKKKFLDFKECLSGVTGEAIADTILSQFSDWQLEPQKIRGKAYDGAGAMAGKVKGAARRPKALYTCCPQAKSLCNEML